MTHAKEKIASFIDKRLIPQRIGVCFHLLMRRLTNSTSMPLPASNAEISRQLAEGIASLTGEVLPRELLLENPQVVRALSHAIQTLDPEIGEAEGQISPNAGKSWTKEEEEALVNEFDAGIPIRNLKLTHGRSGTSPPSAQKWHTGEWTLEEKSRVTDAWSSRDSARDGQLIRSLSKELGRLPYGIILGLYRERSISIPEGDALCRELETNRLLSQAEFVKRGNGDAHVVEEKAKLPSETSSSPQNRIASKITKPAPAMPRRVEGERSKLSRPLPKPALSSQPVLGAKSERYCVDCSQNITERISRTPSATRCLPCQGSYEIKHGYKVNTVSTFAGSDEEVRRMKGRQWGEMVNRGRKR